jgi:hypothetical protein
MYVNPFWMGVLITIVVEIVTCIMYAIMSDGGKGRKK